MEGKNKLFLFLLFLGIAASCDSDRIFEEYHGMQELHWSLEDTASFEVEVVDPNASTALLGVRYNDTYEFHNLYIRYLLADSLGNTLMDSLINIHLFDPKSGKPLGDGFGNVQTKYDTLPWMDVPPGQMYKFQFIQYMRVEELGGIEAVGLKINGK